MARTLNGSGSAGTRPTANVAAGRDPLAGVLSMGPRIPVTVVVVLAVVLHAGAAAGATAAALLSQLLTWNRSLQAAIAAELSQEVDIDIAKPPPLPEPPKEEAPKEEPKPEEPPPPKAPKDTPPPPPAPAEAAKILAQEPDPNETIDMRDSFVQGTGATYAGGVTSSSGTSKSAVYNTAASPKGVPGGTGTQPAPQPAAPSKARAASLSGSTDWGDCPFPPEADADQIDDAYVTIQVQVKPDGGAASVNVTQDPGHGFGREARRCAMRKRFTSALDADGSPIAGTTKAFRVHFQR